jgi:citrate synthase
MHHTFLHENMKKFRAFRYDAHPMGMMISAMAFMSTLHKEANQVFDECRRAPTSRCRSSASCPPWPPSATATALAARSTIPTTT